MRPRGGSPIGIGVSKKRCCPSSITLVFLDFPEFHGAMQSSGGRSSVILNMVALASLESPEPHGAKLLLWCKYRRHWNLQALASLEHDEFHGAVEPLGCQLREDSSLIVMPDLEPDCVSDGRPDQISEILNRQRHSLSPSYFLCHYNLTPLLLRDLS